MKPGAKPARGGRGMRDPQAGRAQGWKERMIDEATRAGVRAGSALWSSVNAIARAVPKTKQDFGVPVISVGNLQAGGAGKTPVVIEIVRLLIAMGARPAVITRGYRSLAEREGGLLFTENGRVECEVTGCRVGGTETGAPGGDRARLFGDEATLIHERTGVPVFVGRARAENYRRHVSRLEASARPTVLVLDDGFQQFGLKKDLEVVCVTDLVPGEVVHREFASALRPEHYVLSTKRRAGVGGGIASVAAGRKPDGSLELRSDPSALGPDVRAGGAVLVTGIAAGARVKNELADAGIRILAWHEFPDHHPYSVTDLESIESDAGPAASAPILTTEKDWMKLRTLVSDPARYRVVPLGLVWIDGETALKERLWRLLRES